MNAAVGGTKGVAQSSDFFIFTSYLWEWSSTEDGTIFGHHYHLPLHRRRLIAAAQAFGWNQVHNLLIQEPSWEKVIATVNQYLQCQTDTDARWRKVKLCLYGDFRIHVESTAIQPADPRDPFPIPSSLDVVFSASPCKVFLSTRPVAPSRYTKHKTSERSVYDQARSLAKITHSSPCSAEVLLFSSQQEASECSLSTPYFKRDHRWVTPPLSCGGNAGTTRVMGLERSLCEEGVVLVESLHDQELMWISNGVRGFIPAILHLSEPAIPKDS